MLLKIDVFYKIYPNDQIPRFRHWHNYRYASYNYMFIMCVPSIARTRFVCERKLKPNIKNMFVTFRCYLFGSLFVPLAAHTAFVAFVVARID